MNKPSDRALWAVFAWGLVTVIAAVIVLALTACQPDPGHEPFPGSTVPAAAPVAWCEDTYGIGPCFQIDDAPDGSLYRWYVPTGGQYPDAATRGPRYVPLCIEAGLSGPCVGRMGDSDTWLYIGTGATFPHGTAVRLCPGDMGGPDACVWVPSFQADDQGDSGAYLFG